MKFRFDPVIIFGGSFYSIFATSLVTFLMTYPRDYEFTKNVEQQKHVQVQNHTSNPSERLYTRKAEPVKEFTNVIDELDTITIWESKAEIWAKAKTK